MSVVGGIFLLWFIMPQMSTAYTTIKSIVDITDPTTAQVAFIGDNVFALSGFLIVVVVLFSVIVYFVRREPIDLRF